MPRPPSKHGLERKYKSWRKGKGGKHSIATSQDGGPLQTSSGTSGGGGSLKNQLRSQRRLLSKLVNNAKNSDDAEVANSRKAIEDRIEEIEKQIKEKEKTEREKKFAVK